MDSETLDPKSQDQPAVEKEPRSLYISVGDPSADIHAAKLIRKLKELEPSLKVWGVGSVAMREAGAEVLYDCEEITAIGIIEVIRFLPRLARVRARMRKLIAERKPAALLLMDFGGFNVGFATYIRSQLKHVPIIYFISPQVWGSRPWRINAIAKAVTKMLVIFPFEEPLYRRKGVNAHFVGHPLTQKFKPENERRSKEEFCKLHGLDPARPIIAVFPGSRKQEIKSHAEIVLQAIDWLAKERPELQFVVAKTNQPISDIFQDELEKHGFTHLLANCLKTVFAEHNEELMTHADLLWTKSGTTTLEATLIGKPMLIFYRGSWLTYILLTIFKIVKYVGWPNLLHGDVLVPELIMMDCRAEQLVRYTTDWLDVPALRKEIGASLRVLKGHLGEGNFTDNAATEILVELNLAPRH